MKIVLLGIQGSGKSTQGELLAEKLGLPYLSTGKMFREMATKQTKQGRYIRNIINKGKLVPDDIVVSLMKGYLARPGFKNGYILDGFPRTLNQAKAFSQAVDVSIYLDVSDKEALWRLANRNDISRQDETLKAVRERLAAFHEQTQPLINYFRKQGKLITINGEQPIKKIHQDIMKSLKQVKG